MRDWFDKRIWYKYGSGRKLVSFIALVGMLVLKLFEYTFQVDPLHRLAKCRHLLIIVWGTSFHLLGAFDIFRPHIMGEENHKMCCAFFRSLQTLHDLPLLLDYLKNYYDYVNYLNSILLVHLPYLHFTTLFEKCNFQSPWWSWECVRMTDTRSWVQTRADVLRF